MTLYANHSRDELIEEIEEYRALCDQLSSILTRTANALKGEPKPLHRHSWHDLPDVAAMMACTRIAHMEPDRPTSRTTSQCG